MAFELTEGGHLKRKRFLRLTLSIRGYPSPPLEGARLYAPLTPSNGKSFVT
jgi:hypothetical protein